MPELTDDSMAQSLWQWFRGCPYLSGKIGVDYLADKPDEYAVYAIPSTIRMTENVLGEVVPSSKQERNFYFASKEPYGADARQTMANQAFYEKITEWVWQQNAAHNMPKIQDGNVLSIVPTLTALIANAGADTAKYQIQLKLTYRRN